MKNFKMFIYGVTLTLSAIAHAIPSTNQPQASMSWLTVYTATNGTIWSDSLPGVYKNCISIMDAHDNPLPSRCEENASGSSYLGISSNGLTVIDSDAVRACKAVGGELPTLQDFTDLGDVEYAKLNAGSGNLSFWTATISTNYQHMSNQMGGTSLFGNLRFLIERDSSEMATVRCVRR